jgi:hypothetical protein
MFQPGNDPEVRLGMWEARRGIPPPEPGPIGQVFLLVWPVLGVLVAAMLIFALLGQIAQGLREYLAAPAADGVKALKGVSAGAALAAALYILRRAKLMVYGMLEIAFGIANTAHVSIAATASGTELTVLIPFAASVYVLVRGLDNFFKGREAGLRVIEGKTS